MWTKKQIGYHKKAAKLLIKIKDLVFEHIRENRSIYEYEVQQFIFQQFRRFDLETDKYPPIVAFSRNSATPEFYPKKISEKLKADNLVLIDLWAKLKIENAPFADITWVAFNGKKIPSKIKRIFHLVISARSNALSYIETQLKNNIIPTGEEIETAGFKIIKKAGYGSNILHELGHSIGTKEDHGPKPNWIYRKNKNPLLRNLAYTIEPGIYINNEFGIRSEIDFYISDNNKIVVTTDLQKEIALL